MTRRIHRFGTKIRKPRHELCAERRVGRDEFANLCRFGAESRHEVVVAVARSGAEQVESLCRAASAAAKHVQHFIHRVFGHLAIRRQLATRDGDHARVAHHHLVAARQVGGAALGSASVLCGDERPQACPRADHVVASECATAARDRLVERAQAVVDVFWRALRVVDAALVVGVGGADIGVAVRAITVGHVRHDEERPLVARNGDDNGDVVANKFPRHGDVDAFGRSDGD